MPNGLIGGAVAAPIGTWTRQGQRRIGDAAGGANDRNKARGQ